MRFLKSPNFTHRSEEIKFIVLHYTQVNLNETLKIFLDPKSELSAHYVIAKSGEIIKMVDDSCVAWHAGKSFWRKTVNLNQTSIGIEIENDGKSEYTDVQITKLIYLLDQLRSKYLIADINIVGHSDIAPLRKSDPGKHFPWHVLASFNHGIYCEYDVLTDNNVNLLHENIKDSLKYIGYDQNLCNDLLGYEAVVKSFVNHFACNYKNIPSELEIIKLANLILTKI
ncbi:MAG: N-acetylmuramoyl-L-alanine amidase [Rickettsiales bacterium]|nr:N-acetylmuramoyl-L-alanine amidase [Rickettsiales bacterium]